MQAPTVWFIPLVSSLCLGLVDPGLIDLHRVGSGGESPVQQDVFQSRAQKVAQRVVTTSMAVKVDQHLDDSGVPCDHFLRLSHLQSDLGKHKVCSGVRKNQQVNCHMTGSYLISYRSASVNSWSSRKASLRSEP